MPCEMVNDLAMQVGDYCHLRDDSDIFEHHLSHFALAFSFGIAYIFDLGEKQFV